MLNTLYNDAGYRSYIVIAIPWTIRIKMFWSRIPPCFTLSWWIRTHTYAIDISKCLRLWLLNYSNNVHRKSFMREPHCYLIQNVTYNSRRWKLEELFDSQNDSKLNWGHPTNIKQNIFKTRSLLRPTQYKQGRWHKVDKVVGAEEETWRTSQ